MVRISLAATLALTVGLLHQPVIGGEIVSPIAGNHHAQRARQAGPAQSRQQSPGRYAEQLGPNRSYNSIMPVSGTETAAANRRSAEQDHMRCDGQHDGLCATRYCDSCCPSFWEHRTKVFGEFLLLAPRDVDVRYATPVDGLGAAAVPIGRSAVADLDHDPGFRVGGSLALDSQSSLSAGFTHYESDTSHSVTLPGGAGFLRADLVHPNTDNVAADSLSASSRYDIDFDLVDIDYRGLLCGGCDHYLNYVIGFRYGRLDQDLRANYIITGDTTVDTEINFDGFGPRLGLEGEQYIGRGFLVYGKGFASFLGGEFRADYSQNNVFAGNQARAGFDDDRIVSLLQLELGLGWQSKCGRFRASAGYHVASWFNTVTTPEFIDAVQNNDINDGEDQILTFDGLATRVEYRF